MGLQVETPESFRKAKVIDGLEDLQADVACVVAYGQILPQRALDAPKYGCLNLHGSLLPRWRGAAPVQRAIMAGDAQTGVQIMQMAKGLDTGDILLSESTDIRATDTAETLSQRLSQLGAQMWPRVLGGVEREALNWSRSARNLEAHIRGLSPFPGAWCEIDDRRVKIHLAKVVEGQGQPGEILDDHLTIACGEGRRKIPDERG